MVKEPTHIKKHYEVASVRKALAILCAFTPETPSLTLSDLSRVLKIPKSTAFNLLSTLQCFNFVSLDPLTKHYRLGRRMFELGTLFSRRSDLVACATPHLRHLSERTKETVKLGVLADAKALVITAIESPLILHTRGDEGRLASLHCTSLGKALLALLSEDEMRDLIARAGLMPSTLRTVTSLGQLEREIAEIKSRGYSVDLEENEEGVCCLGAPVIGAAGSERASISISGPASRFTTERMSELAALVVETAKAISVALGEDDA